MNFTPQQRQFIDTLKSTPSSLALIAVAGAGKTTTMVGAVKELPSSASVAAVAFNTRIAKTLEQKMPSHVNSRTFNSIGHRAFASAIGRKLTLNADKMDQIALDMFPKEKSSYANTVMAKAIKSQGLKPEDVSSDWFEELADMKEFFTRPKFDQTIAMVNKSIDLANSGLVDFDDQIYMSVRYRGVFDRHDYVLADESQDLSPLQLDMLGKLGRKTCVYSFIGDPNQAIYGFRGAGNDSMERAIERFNCAQLPLSVSFRCPTKVVELAKEFVPRIEAAEGAPAGTICDLRGAKWDADMLVPGDTILCRNNAPLISLALRLFQRNKPARVLGKDIGQGLIRLIASFGSDNDHSAVMADRAIEKLEIDLRVANEKRKFSRAAQIEDRIETIAMMRDFAPTYWRDWKAQLQQLFQPPSGLSITLSSIHKAKGLEWDRVWFLDRALLPSPRCKNEDELQQENNLVYVALTRVVGNGTLGFINSKDYS